MSAKLVWKIRSIAKTFKVMQTASAIVFKVRSSVAIERGWAADGRDIVGRMFGLAGVVGGAVAFDETLSHENGGRELFAVIIKRIRLFYATPHIGGILNRVAHVVNLDHRAF